MPHLVIERLRAEPDWRHWGFSSSHADDVEKAKPKRRSRSFAFFVEISEILAGMTFVVGSVLFLPRYSDNLPLFEGACILFVVGSVIYLAICLYCLSEAVEHEGWRSLEAFENMLYVVGSLVFVFGTCLYWPMGISDPDMAKMYVHFGRHARVGEIAVASKVNELQAQFDGTVLFITGSLMFAFAAFVNALNQRQSDDIRSQLLTVITTMYMLGSLLFVIGSVAFIPIFGCNVNMSILGAWCFIVGSMQFEIGAWISLFRTMIEFHSPENATLEQKMFASSARSSSVAKGLA